MKRNIILVGSMGSGKSHLGRNLAEAKQWQFVDTDRVLEKQYGLPIAEIYEKLGEKGFKKAEWAVLKKVCLYHEAVISVGGNFPVEMNTLRYMQRYAFIIGIVADEYRIVKRINRRIGKRPTMDYTDVDGFVETMLRRWKPIYKRCDFRLDTTHGRTEEMIRLIEKELVKQKISFKERRHRDGEAKQGEDL